MNDTRDHELLHKMGGIEQAVKNIDYRLERIDTKLGKQNSRIDKLENWRWFLTGIAIGMPFMVNFLLRILAQR